VNDNNNCRTDLAGLRKHELVAYDRQMTATSFNKVDSSLNDKRATLESV
jgi:hypothetical protein